MIAKVNIKARIKSNKFDELAGEYYQDENSKLVKDLNYMDKKALVGIKRPDGIYTVIGEEFVYYLTASGKEGQIANNDLLIILRENALAKGKRGHFEFLQVNEQDAVWFLDMKVMNAMWNLILLLNRVITGKKL